MNAHGSETGDEVPVVCRICRTRMDVSIDQIGQDIACPDCESLNRVVAPEAPRPDKRPRVDGGYRLSADADPAGPATHNLIKVICTTCHTLMYARPEHAGRRIKCPDCDSMSVVNRPPDRKPRFLPPDVSDISVEQGPPPRVDEDRKEIADRLMAEAQNDVDRKARERSRGPKNPLREGIYTFPLYPNVIPLWVGTSMAVMIDFAIIGVLIETLRTGGMGAILAAFLVPIVAVITFSIAGVIAPHFLTIIEFTADGYDKIPYWPSQDLLSRMHAMLFGINALAISTMPGMVLVGIVQGWGVPMQLGLLSTVLLLPLIVLSMAENGSVFAPYSRVVFGSIRPHFEAWSRFYIQVFVLACAILAVDFIIWTANSQFEARSLGTALTSKAREYIAHTMIIATVCLYAIVYCRLVGRMAWIIGNVPPKENEGDDALAGDSPMP